MHSLRTELQAAYREISLKSDEVESIRLELENRTKQFEDDIEVLQMEIGIQKDMNHENTKRQ
jgi:hypothetical protein